MMLDVLLIGVCLVSVTLGVTSVPFRQGRCDMKFVGQKRTPNRLPIPTRSFPDKAMAKTIDRVQSSILHVATAMFATDCPLQAGSYSYLLSTSSLRCWNL